MGTICLVWYKPSIMGDEGRGMDIFLVLLLVRGRVLLHMMWKLLLLLLWERFLEGWGSGLVNVWSS